jgi:aryl-alcohol dehydrogenase-like predicted oxidoreductase
MTEVTGYATPEGTEAYFRSVPTAAPGHSRPTGRGVRMSSIGLGTGGFRPTNDTAAIMAYADAVRLALTGGINVVDTAISYGHGFAERVTGAVIRSLMAQGRLTRAQVVVATKAGYLASSVDEFRHEFVDTGRCRADDLVAGQHCMAPAFLLDQIDRSRGNLGLNTIDIHLIHNPEEQYAVHGVGRFTERLTRAFEALETAVADGRIRCYGVATAEGLRVDGTTFHGLDVLLACARAVAGERHHMRVVELPINLAMREAVADENHTVDTRPATVLDAAANAGLTVLASVAIARGHLPAPLPRALVDVCPGQPDPMVALQYTRSLPGVDVALVGMSRSEHVRQALRLAGVEPLDLLAEPARP